MELKVKYHALGCMSGTSLDGIDLAFCSFFSQDNSIKFDILKAETIPYDRKWKNNLKLADQLSGRELFRLDHEYGKFLGGIILNFIRKHSLKPDFIASHGHTVFHEPWTGGSLQIGNGHDIHAVSGRPVIADFRNMDIAIGGQGAPLVPIGDEYLFQDYDYCLNLGGFSNISFKKNGVRLAYDICPVNSILNEITTFEGMDFDRDGDLGRKGKAHPLLVDRLNSLEYFRKSPPKSMGKEFLRDYYYPVLNKFDLSTKDILATLYEHISTMILEAIGNDSKKRVFITGGGAKNKFLVEQIDEQTTTELVIAEEKMINFKEALVFAFLGVLKLEGKNNVSASVTGAREDNCSGIIFNTKQNKNGKFYSP